MDKVNIPSDLTPYIGVFGNRNLPGLKVLRMNSMIAIATVFLKNVPLRGNLILIHNQYAA